MQLLHCFRFFARLHRQGVAQNQMGFGITCVQRNGFPPEFFGLGILPLRKTRPRKIRIDNHVRRTDFERAPEVLHGLLRMPGSCISNSKVGVRIPIFRIDPNRFFQLGERLQWFIHVSVALRFRNALERFLLDRMLEFAQRNYSARRLLLRASRQLQNKWPVGGTDLPVFLDHRFTAGSRQHSNVVPAWRCVVNLKAPIAPGQNAVSQSMILRAV